MVIGNDTTHYILDDLEAATNYTFYLVAYMPLGASQMSDHVTQRTLEDGKWGAGSQGGGPGESQQRASGGSRAAVPAPPPGHFLCGKPTGKG